MPEFKYSLNSSTIRPTPILQKIAIAGAVGYAGIELWHADIDSFLQDGGRLSDIRKALDDQNLSVPTTIYLRDWFNCPAAAFDKVLEECKRRMDQAVQLGAPYVIASPPGGRADYQIGAERYRRLLELGIKMGVKPSMEFLGFVDQLNTIDDALEIIRNSNHPDATTVLDPFHIFRGGDSVESIAKLEARQVAVSHFNDVPRHPPREQQEDADRVMPGDGIYDLKRYVALLNQIGYQQFISLELFRRDLWAQDPEQVARTGLEKMRAVIEG